MPDSRKPPVYEKAGRADAAPPQGDSIEFSIETTTMRLKSLKLRRAESPERAGEDQLMPSKDPQNRPASVAPAGGRVRHDDRGMAVWDWQVASGEFATLSATNVMKQLDLGNLSIEETQRSVKAMKPVGRDPGGGGDPYNTRGAGQRTGEAAKRQGITGAADRPRDNSVLDQLTGKKK
jgi:hypothetical protein